MSDWKPGDKCRTHMGRTLEIVARNAAGGYYTTKDCATGEIEVFWQGDLEPIPATPEPETCGCEETPDAAPPAPAFGQPEAIRKRDSRIRQLENKLKLARDSRDYWRQKAEEKPSLEPLEEGAVAAFLNEWVGGAFNYAHLARAICSRFGVAAPATVDREKLVECALEWSGTVNERMSSRGPRMVTLGDCENLADALLSSGLLAGGDAALKAEVERLRGMLPTESERRWIMGAADDATARFNSATAYHVRAYLARTKEQA